MLWIDGCNMIKQFWDFFSSNEHIQYLNKCTYLQCRLGGSNARIFKTSILIMTCQPFECLFWLQFNYQKISRLYDCLTVHGYLVCLEIIFCSRLNLHKFYNFFTVLTFVVYTLQIYKLWIFEIGKTNIILVIRFQTVSIPCSSYNC